MYSKIEEQTRRLAQSAKDGVLKHNGKTYTFEFDQKHWVYNVYEDGFFLLKFNTKRITTAKRYLKEWLLN